MSKVNETRDEILLTLSKIIKEVLPSANELEVFMETKFNEIGLDSLDYAQMVITLEMHYGVSILDKQVMWQDITTPATLIDLFWNDINGI